MSGTRIACLLAVTGLLGVGVSGCTNPAAPTTLAPTRDGQDSMASPSAIVPTRDGQQSQWGPLAVVDEPVTVTLAAGRGPGTLQIGTDCVTLQVDGAESTLVWRGAEVSWDDSTRAIVFVSGRAGEMRLSDGETIMVGGAAFRSPNPTWLATPAAGCPAAKFTVHDVTR